MPCDGFAELVCRAVAVRRSRIDRAGDDPRQPLVVEVETTNQSGIGTVQALAAGGSRCRHVGGGIVRKRRRGGRVQQFQQHLPQRVHVAGLVQRERVAPCLFGRRVAGRGHDGLDVGLRHPPGGAEVGDSRHAVGTDWVLDWTIEANGQHKPKGFVFDPKSSTADLFMAKFRDAGLPVIECGFIDRALPQATHGLLDDIANGRIEHLADELLTAAADGAGKRIYGESWLWDRRKPGTVMSPLTAATIARWGLLLPEAKAEPFVFYQ